MTSSNYAYFRALRKTQIFQVLTDSVMGDGDNVVDEIKRKLRGADDNAIIDSAKECQKAINSFVMTTDDDEFPTSSTSPDTSVFHVNLPTFKFWFLVLLTCFLFISAGLFHFFCIGQKNVTRRNSLEKRGLPTETTTIEMITDVVDEEAEQRYELAPSRLVPQD